MQIFKHLIFQKYHQDLVGIAIIAEAKNPGGTFKSKIYGEAKSWIFNMI